jgi:2-hydroxy-6-oxonona-2,4-dienedioate hydrolase
MSEHVSQAEVLAKATRIELPTPGGIQVWHAWNTSAGRPLVLLHGGSGSWTHWLRNIQGLTQDRAVYALDLPGFGDSDLPPDARDADDLQHHVAQGLRQLLGEGPHDVMGFSFGGMTAGFIAAAQPDLIRRLVLVGIPGLGLFGEPLDLRGLRDDMSRQERRDILRHNLLQIMLRHPESVDEATLDLQDANVSRDRLRRRRIARGDVLVRLQSRWQCPVHTIWGEFDSLVEERLYRVPEVLNQCRLVSFHVVPQAGHWVQYERPEAFLKVALRCLAGEGE